MASESRADPRQGKTLYGSDASGETGRAEDSVTTSSVCPPAPGPKASQQAGGTRPLGASSGQSVPVFLGDHPDSTMYIITQAFSSENAFSEEPASFLVFQEMFCSFRFCAAQVPQGSRLL